MVPCRPQEGVCVLFQVWFKPLDSFEPRNVIWSSLYVKNALGCLMDNWFLKCKREITFGEMLEMIVARRRVTLVEEVIKGKI